MRSRLFPANSASNCLRFAKSRPQFSKSRGATYTRRNRSGAARVPRRPLLANPNLFRKPKMVFNYLFGTPTTSSLFATAPEWSMPRSTETESLIESPLQTLLRNV